MSDIKKKALIVIDMQNDYLWDKRKPMFSYDTEKLTAAVNRSISRYRADGGDIIYISQVFPNIVTNRMFIGFSIKNTEGAELYGGMDVVSELHFEKNLSNTFTSKPFREHMERAAYDEIFLCGLDLCGCVGKTALGAAKVCSNTAVIGESTGTRFGEKKISATKAKLVRAGVRII